MDLRLRLLDYIASRTGKPLPLRIAFWDGEHFEFAPAPTATYRPGLSGESRRPWTREHQYNSSAPAIFATRQQEGEAENHADAHV